MEWLVLFLTDYDVFLDNITSVMVSYGKFQSSVSHLLTRRNSTLSLTESLYYSLTFICNYWFGSEVFRSESFRNSDRNTSVLQKCNFHINSEDF